jgi:hypothetical protein
LTAEVGSKDKGVKEREHRPEQQFPNAEAAEWGETGPYHVYAV